MRTLLRRASGEGMSVACGSKSTFRSSPSSSIKHSAMICTSQSKQGIRMTIYKKIGEDPFRKDTQGMRIIKCREGRKGWGKQIKKGWKRERKKTKHGKDSQEWGEKHLLLFNWGVDLEGEDDREIANNKAKLAHHLDHITELNLKVEWRGIEEKQWIDGY